MDAAKLTAEIEALREQDGRICQRTIEVAKLVLVAGVSQSEAARRLGLGHRQSAHRALQVVRRALTRGGLCRICGHRCEEHDRDRAGGINSLV